METQENKDITQYHHNITGKPLNVTDHVSIYDIYTNVITNNKFEFDGETLASKCDTIKQLQGHMNDFDVDSPDYKHFKKLKKDLKNGLGGCYYQKFKPTQKKGEVDNYYTSHLVIDVDEYDHDYTELKAKLEANPNVIMYFTSPSGGLKIIVSTDLKPELNQDLYQIVYNYTFDSLDTGVKFDATARNNNDLICFYAYCVFS